MEWDGRMYRKQQMILQNGIMKSIENLILDTYSYGYGISFMLRIREYIKKNHDSFDMSAALAFALLLIFSSSIQFHKQKDASMQFV